MEAYVAFHPVDVGPLGPLGTLDEAKESRQRLEQARRLGLRDRPRPACPGLGRPFARPGDLRPLPRPAPVPLPFRSRSAPVPLRPPAIPLAVPKAIK
jgi:hypothetical protein